MVDEKFLKEEEEFLTAAVDMKVFCSNEEIANSLCDSYLPSIPNTPNKKDVLLKILQNQELKDEFETKTLYPFYNSEIQFAESISEKKIKDVFYCLVLWRKINPHENGWIVFNREKILRLLFTSKEIQGIKLEFFGKLKELGFEMAVIGSNKPISCYKIPKFEQDDVVFETNVRDFRKNLEELWNGEIAY